MLIILIKKECELVNSFFQFLYLLLMENSSMSSASEYRPKDFNEMIGQDAIVKTLSNAIDSQKIPQALLFCGPRGVGKTSCARILAKKINDLDENFEYNIFELDAASNNSVEDIRNITEQIRIPPQYGKFKVYIIDEVHMLSNAAFNAFLKSLEEPPPHVVFILATTEKNKIIPTILSRCQIYDFKKVDNNSIIGLLHKICKEKKIKFDDSSLQIIAEKSDGSIRDSLSMFDRLVSFTNSNLTIDEVTSNLNILDYESYFDLSSLITNKDIPGILSMYDKVYNRGVDDVNFLNGISKHFRELLINKLDESDIKDDLKIKYKKQGDDYSDEDLILMIDIVNECLINYQKVNDKRIHTEICLMKLASLDIIKKKNSLIKTSKFSDEFIREDQELEKALEANKDNPDYVPVLSYHPSEKGIIGYYFVETDGEDFDPKKLAYSTVETTLTSLIDRVWYDKKELDHNMDYASTTGKSNSAAVGYMNLKWLDQDTPEALKEAWESYDDHLKS